jgi:hypothetical protein
MFGLRNVGSDYHRRKNSSPSQGGFQDRFKVIPFFAKGVGWGGRIRTFNLLIQSQVYAAKGPFEYEIAVLSSPRPSDASLAHLCPGKKVEPCG